MPQTLHLSSSSILVTGGAGFIGSNFVRELCAGFSGRIVVFDALTYAGNLENLAGYEDRFTFVHASITDAHAVAAALREHDVDTVVHFAAESHVDRSIHGPLVFTQTNVLGTHVLLEEARRHQVRRFIHISTDEVYGSLGPVGAFTEDSPIRPTSPYSASKAASDFIVLAYAKTYGFPAIVMRCSNNYGPYQFPEKLIPLMIINALEERPLPVYGDGLNVRDWIHTRDYTSAILAVLEKGVVGEVYNVGSNNEWKNIDIVRLILTILNRPESLIHFVKDRPGHDRRYAIDSTRITTELGWSPGVGFEEGIRDTIAWYCANEPWWRRVMSGEYTTYYTTHYGSLQ